jgi:glycosyltransferase involved in cell wall biosynthesis
MRMLFAVRKSDVIVTNVFWLPMLLTRLRRGAGKVEVNVNRQPKGQMGLYRRAARIVAVSTAIKDAIVAQRPDVATIVKVIPNPIDTRVFTPPPAPRPPRVTTLIYTGRVHPEKGIHVLLSAFRQLLVEFPHLRLRIIGQRNVAQGGGDEAYQKQLDEQSAGLPVEFVPPIYDRKQLADELRGADLYVYPSLADLGEAMPVAPLEAMATGLVVVVSDMPQFRDYVEPDITGLVFNHHSPDPAAELAAAIRRTLSGECRVTDMRLAAARRAAQFGYDEVATMYLNDFAELLAGKK